MRSGDIDRAPIHSDIKTLYLPTEMAPEMLCGGFPCTDISSIGLQKGITETTASGLFLEMVRIVDDTPSIKILFLENVANIVKCGMEDVINELTKRGFSLCWTIKSASSLGAPHQRNRWFCLATKDDVTFDESISYDTSLGCWDAEPERRVSFRPSYKHDESFDDNWIKRWQTLGNTVVPKVVNQAFVDLVTLHRNKRTIQECFGTFRSPVNTLKYPYPENGIIDDGFYYPLPKVQVQNPSSTVKITIKKDGNTSVLERYPTPRHSLSHPSSVTARSLHDLPTLLVYCEESQNYIKETLEGQTLPEKLHSCVTPNVNYIEWMMGYPKNWTQAHSFSKGKKQLSKVNEAAEEDEEIALENKERKKSKPGVTRLNGMHALLKDFNIDIPKRDIRSVAAVWRGLSQERKDYYKNIAKTM
jgi:DNA (cytosine-5)-methyltransferase 1